MTDADRIAREKDLERLRTMAMSLLQENERLMARLGELYKQVAEAKGEAAAQLRLEIAALENEIAKRRARIFQHTSEKRTGAKGKDGEQAKPPQTGHGPREQPKLEVEPVVHDLDDTDKTCSSCGGDLEEWEGQFEESDEVEVVERRYVIKRHKRKKYRCRCGSCIETAPAPQRLIEGAGTRSTSRSRSPSTSTSSTCRSNGRWPRWRGSGSRWTRRPSSISSGP